MMFKIYLLAFTSNQFIAIVHAQTITHKPAPPACQKDLLKTKCFDYKKNNYCTHTKYKRYMMQSCCKTCAEQAPQHGRCEIEIEWYNDKVSEWGSLSETLKNYLIEKQHKKVIKCCKDRSDCAVIKDLPTTTKTEKKKKEEAPRKQDQTWCSVKIEKYGCTEDYVIKYCPKSCSMTATPVTAPVTATPVTATPVTATPVTATPVRACQTQREKFQKIPGAPLLECNTNGTWKPVQSNFVNGTEKVYYCVDTNTGVKKNCASVCSMKKDAGGCLSVYNHFYFDPKEEKCKTFEYYGCLGNANNFDTKEQCDQVCPPSPKELDSGDECTTQSGKKCRGTLKCSADGTKFTCQEPAPPELRI